MSSICQCVNLAHELNWKSIFLTWNIGFALLDDDEVENGEIGVDDAASDASAVTLTRASRTIAFVLSAQKQTNSAVGQHSLHHGETWRGREGKDSEA